MVSSKWPDNIRQWTSTTSRDSVQRPIQSVAIVCRITKAENHFVPFRVGEQRAGTVLTCTDRGVFCARHQGMVGSDMMPACVTCGTHVSTRFARVFAANDGVVHACLECSANRQVADTAHYRAHRGSDGTH